VWTLILVAIAIAVLPYVNAWARTGNPVFPFLNGLFRSHYFDSAASFENWLYKTPLTPGSFYETILSSSRFIEGYDGAAGMCWLLVLPIVLVGLLRRRPMVQWGCVALAALFFTIVYVQQSYLRYLMPAFLLLMIIAGWTLNDFTVGRYGRMGLLLVGASLCLLNLRFMYAAHWPNTTLCPGCAFDQRARDDYVALYAPDRVVSDYLNRNLPDARVGFFMINASSPSGYLGYSRSANWHDVPMYRALLGAQSADDVLALARRFKLTHAVFVETGLSPEQSAISAFQQRYTAPIWRFAGRTVAIIRPG